MDACTFCVTTAGILAGVGQAAGELPGWTRCFEHLRRICAPAAQPSMDALWVVCAVERQYRQWQASLARSFDLADRRVDLELAWFVGIDWGSQKHQACVLDVGGKVVGEREFEHGGAGLTQTADWLLAFATSDAAEVGVAVETPRGPVVESLMERGFAVHSINPKQLDRFRDRISPAGAKDDRRDARVLASALRTDPHCLRRLEPTDPAIVELA